MKVLVGQQVTTMEEKPVVFQLQSNVAMTNPLFLMILTYLKYLNEGFSGTTSDNNGRKTSGFPTALIFSEGNCC